VSMNYPEYRAVKSARYRRFGREVDGEDPGTALGVAGKTARQGWGAPAARCWIIASRLWPDLHTVGIGAMVTAEARQAGRIRRYTTADSLRHPSETAKEGRPPLPDCRWAAGGWPDGRLVSYLFAVPVCGCQGPGQR